MLPDTLLSLTFFAPSGSQWEGNAKKNVSPQREAFQT